MEYFKLSFLGIIRNLPLVAVTPKIRVASVNFLGDIELSEAVSQEVEKKLRSIDFDIMVGPEVKVVPVLHAATKLLNKKSR